jgi:phospholipid transport system substrate-binding protein
VYKPERLGNTEAVIEAIVYGSQMAISIDYYLRNEGGNWKVYDVIIEGTGLVTNYRTQFQQILMRSSIDDLIRQLKERVSHG